MNRRLLTHSTTAVAFLVVCLSGAHRVEGADKDRMRELDVVATTNVKNSEAFVKACLLEIFGQTSSALSSLSPVDASNGKANDGAARYRLLIDHKGTVEVGKKLTVQSSFPRKKEETVKIGKAEIVRTVPDKTYYLSNWFLPVKQKATLTFKLLKWEDGAYQSLDAWTIPVAYREAVVGGLAPVARLEQDAAKGKIDLLPECPISPDEARDEAFAQCEPGPFENAFAARWVKGKFGKLTLNEGEVQYEVAVENKSPWPLSQIFVESATKGQELTGYVEFKPPVAPGKSGKGNGSCFVAEPPAKKAPALRVTEARFEPAER